MAKQDKNPLQLFAEKENESLKEEQRKSFDEQGLAPFLSIPEGTTDLEFDMSVTPRENSKYPNRNVFRVKKGGETYDLSISKNSPFYRDVITNLAAGKPRMTVMRMGTGLDTRYKVAPIEKG